MDDKNMMFLEAMSGLDPVLISEAADKPSTHRTRLVRRISPMAAVAAVLAAIAVSAGSAYAVSVYVEDRARSKQTIVSNEYKKQREAAGIDHGFADNEFITHYSDNATAEVYDQTPFEPIVTENEHIRLTVETCLADEYIVTGIMTIEGLDDEGKSYIRRDLTLTDEEFAQHLDDPVFSTCFPWLTVRDEDGKWLTTITYNADAMFGTEDGKTSFTYRLQKDLLPEGKRSGTARVMVLDDSTMGNGGTDSLRGGIFEGMSFDLPLDQNVGSVLLTADDGSQITISELCFYGEHTDGDYHSPDAPFIIKYQMGRTVVYTNGRFDCEPDTDQGFIEYNTSSLNWMGGTVIDIDALCRVEYKGKTYTPR